MSKLFIQQVIPYTKNGAGNYSIERIDGEWYINLNDFPIKVKKNCPRYARRLLYTYCKANRSLFGTIDLASDIAPTV